MKTCALCKTTARTFCESDRATLCWSCDAKVHGANFLVARHCRTLLCHTCQSPTAWKASGSKLGHTVSFCDSCVDGGRNRNPQGEGGGGNDEDDLRDGDERSDGDESDDDVEEQEEEEEEEEEDDGEEGDNQVVPWSSSTTMTTATSPPPSCSSSEEEEELVSSLCCGGNREVDEFRMRSSLKRMLDDSTDLYPQGFNCSSERPNRMWVLSGAKTRSVGGDAAFAESSRPMKDRRIGTSKDL